LATLSPFNLYDKASQFDPHSRVSPFSSDCFKSTKQNNQSLYTIKQNINSISPTTDNKSHFDLLPTFNKS
jgi:hypothetical protein